MLGNGRKGIVAAKSKASTPSLVLSVESIWSVITSELAPSPQATITTTTLQQSPVISTSDTMMTTTVQVTGPVATVIVDTTLVWTSYVTLQTISTSIPGRPSSTSSVVIPQSRTQQTTLSTSSSILEAVASTSTQDSSHETSSISQSVAVKSRSTSLSVSSTASSSPAASSAPIAAVQSSHSTNHKHAIIGGLSGAIAGLALIAVLLAVFWRRRRPRTQDPEGDHVSTEKRLRPAIARPITDLAAPGGSPRPSPLTRSRSSTVNVDEEHHIIRMNTRHWPRPYATGHGEGYRESILPGQLRVTNPDISRPSTPRTISDSAAEFLKKQRSALTAVLLGTARSRASSLSQSDHSGLVREATASTPNKLLTPPKAATPSYRSRNSVASLPTIEQQPPEDPFITPPLESPDIASTAARPQRPALAPIQSAASSVGRTLSHLGSAVNPFQTRSSVNVSVRSRSQRTVSLASSTRRDTSYSDPFDLDEPRRQTGITGADPKAKGELPVLTVYEGT